MFNPDVMPSLTRAPAAATRQSRDAFRAIDYRAYLLETMATFRQLPAGPSEPMAAPDLPDRIFQVLTGRDYCYLSGARVAPYREEILGWISKAAAGRTPIRFFLDVGGGYHATLEPGAGPLSFGVGLAELMILRQIRSFVARVGRLHGPGARFTLIIDNMCAALINDISVERTAGYCEKLRALICETGMSDLVDLLVESEHLTDADFAGVRDAHAVPPARNLSAKQHENVERFLGRRCDGAEAAERTRLYAEVTTASEALLRSRIDGVRMTQRASATTICFRPFPGGASRIQAGEVALLGDAQGKVRPILLTSRNVGDYSCLRDAAPECLPSSISHVTYARPVAG